MKHENYSLFQYENAKDLYLGSYERLVTFFTLVNSGGIIYVITLLSGDTKDKYHIPFQFCKIAFYSLNWSLISFSIALALSFIILLIDLFITNKEVRRINRLLNTGVSIPRKFNYKIYLAQWGLGFVAILFSIAGTVLALMSVIYRN